MTSLKRLHLRTVRKMTKHKRKKSKKNRRPKRLQLITRKKISHVEKKHLSMLHQHM